MGSPALQTNHGDEPRDEGDEGHESHEGHEEEGGRTGGRCTGDEEEGHEGHEGHEGQVRRKQSEEGQEGHQGNVSRKRDHFAICRLPCTRQAEHLRLDANLISWSSLHQRIFQAHCNMYSAMRRYTTCAWLCEISCRGSPL